MTRSPESPKDSGEKNSSGACGEDEDESEDAISAEQLRDNNNDRSDEVIKKINLIVGKLVIEDGGFVTGDRIENGSDETNGPLDLLKTLYEDRYPGGVILLIFILVLIILILVLVVLVLLLLKLDSILEIFGYILL